MEIATCSFGTFTPDMGQPVRIALQVPKFRPEAAKWPQVYRLCPRWSYFRAAQDDYDNAFIDQLNRFGVDSIIGRLHSLGREMQASRLVLLCFEPDSNACHRGLLSLWWRQQTGEVIRELR